MKIKEIFFTDIEGILIFDKQKFIWFIDSKDFLPDSYTSFKNKIGLINKNRNYISSNNDVVLAFPFKDCVLQGGQDKEEVANRTEIMYNEIIAYEDIRRMLAPKVFTKAKRYTEDRVEENIILDDDLYLPISLCLANEYAQSMGNGKYCRLFIFSTHSSLAIPCPLSWYLNVFQQQETHYNRISFKFDSYYLFSQCDKKLSYKDIHER